MKRSGGRGELEARYWQLSYNINMTLKLVYEKPIVQKVSYGKDFINVAGMKMIFCEWGPKSFWMSSTPVTREQFAAIAGEKQLPVAQQNLLRERAMADEYGMSEEERAQLPKVLVDRTDAVAYCYSSRWLVI